MNKRQREILINSATVITITVVTIVAMINFKDYVNWSESMQAMKQLGQIVIQYRKAQGCTPPETYINDIKEELAGRARVGHIQYRARWIDFGADPNEILAYVRQDYHSFVMHNGYIVLRLDGRVEWMEPKKFEKLLATQQKPMEMEELKK